VAFPEDEAIFRDDRNHPRDKPVAFPEDEASLETTVTIHGTSPWHSPKRANVELRQRN
jgi:hypothetical protein